jgi:methyl-accepting chemotaxis protein
MVVMARNGEERTDEGVSAITNTGAILNDLSYAIQEASKVANEIDSAVSQQSMGLSQISAAMDEINVGSVENQKISQNMDETTMKLTSNLEELAVVVDIWSIDSDTEDS